MALPALPRPWVFTNGVFDVLHRGHVMYLAQARELGASLIVALNTDASVSKLKGPTRPVQKEQGRATVLASLSSVDLVVLFDEDTPLNLILACRPDVLVKGGDWPVDRIVGAGLQRSDLRNQAIEALLDPARHVGLSADIARTAARRARELAARLIGPPGEAAS